MALELDRNRLRKELRLRFHQLVDARVPRVIRPGGIPLKQQAMAIFSGHLLNYLGRVDPELGAFPSRGLNNKVTKQLR